MTEQIAAALLKLDVTNDDHWTADGQPKIEALRLLAGSFGLKREDVTKTAPNFSRSNPSLDPVDQGVVKPTPIVPQENQDASADTLQGAGDSVTESESEFEGQDLETQLSRARVRLEQATSAKHQADQACREASAEVDRLIEAGAASTEHDSFSKAMTRHLKQQEILRRRRGEQLQRLRDSNINIKDLIPQKPPIETAIANSVIQGRKTRAANGG